MNKHKRIIIINEDVKSGIIEDILTESFTPSHEKVMAVKEYLDKNFARVLIDDIDDDGYPVKDKMVNMLSDGQPLKTMSMMDLLLMLDDKFHSIIKDKRDRKKFLKQVIMDWYDKKLTKDGILSVNSIK